MDDRRLLPAMAMAARSRIRRLVAAAAAVAAAATAGEPAQAEPAVAFFRTDPEVAALAGLGLLALLAAIGMLALLYRQSRYRLATLERSNDRLDGFVEATSDWVWQTDTEHRLVFLSSKFAEQTGIPLRQALGRTPFDLWLKQRPDLAERHRATIAQRRAFRDAAYPLTLQTGEIRWFSANGVPRFDAQGRFLGYLGATRDVTAELTSKRQLDDTRAITSYLYDAVPDAIVFCRPDRRIVRVNPRFTALFGYTQAEVAGRTTEFLYDSPDEYRASGTRIFDANSARSRAAEIYRMRRKNGDIVMVEVAGSMVHNDDGEAIGNVGVLRDISVREAANAELLRAKEAAELANRSKSQFLAHMSHELRTPLNAILGFSEILKLEMHGKLGDRRYAEYVEDIHGSGALLLAMINDILDLSRIEAGKLDLYDRDIDLGVLVDESVRFLRERANRRGISIQTGDSVDDVLLFADERLVKQMLLNLLSNAVKFTPPEGTIRVFVTLDEFGELCIAVADTGIGIAPEDVERVRRPFAQANNVWHKTGEGAGIGLYLVDSLIKAHGGTMHIASELGNGTIVTLRFPAARVHIAANGGDFETVG